MSHEHALSTTSTNMPSEEDVSCTLCDALGDELDDDIATNACRRLTHVGRARIALR